MNHWKCVTQDPHWTWQRRCLGDDRVSGQMRKPLTRSTSYIQRSLKLNLSEICFCHTCWRVLRPICQNPSELPSRFLEERQLHKESSRSQKTLRTIKTNQKPCENNNVNKRATPVARKSLRPSLPSSCRVGASTEELFIELHGINTAGPALQPNRTPVYPLFVHTR